MNVPDKLDFFFDIFQMYSCLIVKYEIRITNQQNYKEQAELYSKWW